MIFAFQQLSLNTKISAISRMLWFTGLLILVVNIYASNQIINSTNQTKISNLERELIRQGLIDIQQIDPTIKVELKYSTTDNFLNQDVYGDLEKCFLQKRVALKLAQAQQQLKSINPGYSLKVFDGARPRRIQKKMWKIVKNTPQQEYVANPQKGSIHNYGAAIDLTIVDSKDQELDMGTPYDFFGDLAKPTLESKFLKQGKLSKEQINSRKILREVMTKAGFLPILNEWWHFEAFPKQAVRKKYKIIE
jgi:D-alanyl-D-alanine dipeptidase